MPYNELQRRDSWPPTVVRIRDEEPAAEITSAIDENPFSFFLTSPDDIDDDEDLSAGIESSSKPAHVREISPSALQRSLLPLNDVEDEEEVDYGFAMPLSLKDFQAHSKDGRSSRQGDRVEDRLLGLGISSPDLGSRRGRATVQMIPSRSGRGRQTRSLSARRPHSWRVPSPDIGTIKEERESDDGEDNLKIELKMEQSVSAPPSPEVKKKEVVKPRKRVHWAF